MNIKYLGIGLIAFSALFMGCDKEEEKGKSNEKPVAAFNMNREISVITREAGSGTRDAFIEIAGLLEKTETSKRDLTTQDAITIDGTQAVMSNVSGNEYAIGYISLGSLNSSTKALKIEGVPVSSETVKDGSYRISRPFNFVTKGKESPLVLDFIGFVMSADGQKIAQTNGYIAITEGEAYTPSKISGKIVIAGSSSVAPLAEKLKEAYIQINPHVEIELQINDSSAGILSAKEGTSDIGLASRDLKESELAEVKGLTIAKDGIAVIINHKNPVDNITLEQLRGIYSGAIKNWGAVLEK